MEMLGAGKIMAAELFERLLHGIERVLMACKDAELYDLMEVLGDGLLRKVIHIIERAV